MSIQVVLSAASPSQATTKIKECIDTWSYENEFLGGIESLEIFLNCTTSRESFILTVASGDVVDHSTQSSEAVNPTLATFMDLLSTSTDSVTRDLEVVSATLSDLTITSMSMQETTFIPLTISAKAHITTSVVDPAEQGSTANTFVAASISTAHGYLGLRIAQCLESGVDQWGYIVSAYSGSKFRIDIRNPKGDKRGVDKQSFLALAKDNMETMQAWVYSGYLKQNDMNISISSTGSAIVRLAYIGKVSVSARDSEQYDQYKGKETISTSYRS